MDIRRLAIGLAALMSLGLAACGHSDKTVVVTPPSNTAPAQGTTVVTPPSGTTTVVPAQ